MKKAPGICLPLCRRVTQTLLIWTRAFRSPGVPRESYRASSRARGARGLLTSSRERELERSVAQGPLGCKMLDAGSAAHTARTGLTALTCAALGSLRGRGHLQPVREQDCSLAAGICTEKWERKQAQRRVWRRGGAQVSATGSTLQNFSPFFFLLVLNKASGNALTRVGRSPSKAS